MKILKLIFIVWLLISFTTQAQIYVDVSATGNNDGSSWADAFNDIQSAVDAAMDNDVIQIAEGTYQQGTDILITKPVTIIGGYPTGGGVQDISNNSTVLDGNITHRVITATHPSGTLYLEGMTIQNGYTNTQGGGIHTTNPINLNFIKLLNNKSSSTSTSAGGGIYGYPTTITLSNSEVIGNSSAPPIITSGTQAYGGGIYGHIINLSNTLVSDNFCHAGNASDGGGIYGEEICCGDTSITLTDSQVLGNSLEGNFSSGGGIRGNGTITLTNSQVTGNSIIANDTVSGAGILGIREITLTNSKITGNSIESPEFAFGGGIYGGSSIALINSQVSGNSSLAEDTSSGGGIYLSGGTGVLLTNSMVSGNTLLSFNNDPVAGGIYGSTVLQNSILWGNGDNGLPNEHEGGSLSANFSLIKSQNPVGTGNIDATASGFDPLFIDEVGGDYRLQSGSPLIDAGDFNLLPLDDFDVDGDGDLLELIPLDLGGYARDVGFDVDIGPYEFGDLIFRDGFE